MSRRRHRLIAVSWNDANGAHPRDGEFEPDDHAPVPMLTIGWLLCQDKRGISLANERQMIDGSFRGQTFIPAEMVVKVKTISTKGVL